MTAGEWVMLGVLVWIFLAAVAIGVVQGGTCKRWPCRHPKHPCFDCVQVIR